MVWRRNKIILFSVISIIVSILIIATISFKNMDKDKFISEKSDESPDGMKDIKEVVTEVELTGFCYNPDYPEYGSHKEEITIDLDDYHPKQIISQKRMTYYFLYIDDHYSNARSNTGDIMSIRVICLNNTNDEFMEDITQPGFEGGSIITQISYCDAEGRGKYFDTKWYIEVEISNCGEYPKYGGPGVITEPDQGNEWNATFTFTYNIYV